MLLFAVAALAPLRFHVDASQFANAVYHVACLTGRAPCTKTVFERFWNEQYHVTREDGRRFDEFASAMDGLESAAGEIPSAPFLPNYSSFYPPLDLRARIMAAALGSNSAADFRRRARDLGNPEAIGRIAAVFDAVEQRLHPWWGSTGAPLAQFRVAAMQRQLQRLGVPRLAGEMAAFFEVSSFPRDVYLHIIPSPEFNGKAASATPSLNHFCLELTRDAEDTAAAWGTIHELTHSLYDAASPVKKRSLMDEFVTSSDAAAQGLYMYLNEAVATAVQLLILERNGRRDDDPYHDRYIPRLAFQTLPLLRDALSRRGTLFHGFAALYLAAGRRALGNEADSLAFRFSTPAVLGEPDLQSAFLEVFAPHWVVTGENDARRFPHVRVVRVRPSTGPSPRGAASLSATGELLLTGRDRNAIADLARKLSEWRGAVEPGPLFTID